MGKITSSGKSFKQGWNDSLASIVEKPAMRSSFTYDFYLDTTEVTQKHFFDCTGRRPVPESSLYGVGDAYPVYYVSWFDAVLFCNARSNAEKVDTVYTYSAIKTLPSGSVYELTGLCCLFSGKGYRLPTEAEWEFAGRGASSALPYSTQSDSLLTGRKAWYLANSNEKSSPMAQKEPNSLGLYDMAGNLFEWTNDWKGPNSAGINRNSLYLSATTYFQKISAGHPIGSPRLLCSGGGFHDGLSTNGRYSLSAYSDLLVYDRISAKTTQLFLSPANGKDASGSTQVCNASLSPDTGDNPRCLFLDFGYPRVSTITVKSYRTHQYLFIATPKGKVIDYIDSPGSEAAWDQTEWSNSESFAIAFRCNQCEQARHIYAIKLRNHTILQLVGGTELAQPALWLSELSTPSGSYALDSLCLYDEPHLTFAQTEIAYLLHYYWQCHDNLDLVFVGNSHIFAGIDCSICSRYRAQNITIPGAGLSSIVNLISKYVLTQASKDKVIGINAPISYLNTSDGEAIGTFWDQVIGRSKGYQYDKNHNFWKDSITDELSILMQKQPFPTSQLLTSVGFKNFPSQNWGGPAPSLEGDVSWTIDNANYQANFASIVELISTLSAKKIHVLMIVFPESPYYKNTDYYSRYGPSRTTGIAVMKQFKALENEYPYFHLYDANLSGNHDYSDLEAFDYDHLSYRGVTKLTKRVDSLINRIVSPVP
jgi:hypothetical protein